MGLYEKNILGRENNLNQKKPERYNISWYSMRIASNLVWLKHGTEKKELKGASQGIKQRGKAGRDEIREIGRSQSMKALYFLRRGLVLAEIFL